MSQLGYAKYRFQPRPACFREEKKVNRGRIAWVPVLITELASTATGLAGHEGPEQPRPLTSIPGERIRPGLCPNCCR